jgi:hypothetical protein
MSNKTETPITLDDQYWRQHYSSRPYTEMGASYEDYESAYQVGHEGYDRYPGKSFDEAEAELKHDYEVLSAQDGGTGFDWDKVKDAARDAWDQAGTT